MARSLAFPTLLLFFYQQLRDGALFVFPHSFIFYFFTSSLEIARSFASRRGRVK
jgi:hypothetical protein